MGIAFERLLRLVAFVLVGVALDPSRAQAQDIREELWGTNGTVHALAVSGDTIYLGGDFSEVAPFTGRWVGLDATSAAPQLPYSKVMGGSVRAAASDGSGGWFIGGSFSSVRGQLRDNIAHLDNAGNLTSWNSAGANGGVEALAVSGDTVYVGGAFSSIGGQARNKIAALHAATGAVLTWNPGANGTVEALCVSGGTLYVGGTFSDIDGETRRRIAAIDAATGTVLSGWDASVTGPGKVEVLAIHGGTLYVGGDFTTIGGAARNRIAALDAATSVVLPWDPDVDDKVQALAPSGGTVYVGGWFTKIGIKDRDRIAAIDTATGVASNWDPGANLGVEALVVSGGTVYAGGSFTVMDGKSRRRIAAINTSNGKATDWDPKANSDVFTLAVDGNVVYAGGNLTSAGAETRNNIAALDAIGGEATDWNPGADGTVQALAVSGSTLYVGGAFSTIAGQVASGVAALSTAADSALWTGNTAGTVSALAVGGTELYVGGTFTGIGGAPRANIAALDAATGATTTWDPDANGTVSALAVSGSTIYAGGSFTNIGKAARNRIAALNKNGDATTWNPNADGSVYALAVDGDTIYAGGFFSLIGPDSRNNIAAIDASTEMATSWNPSATNPSASPAVRALAVKAGTVYAGGDFVMMGGVVVRNRIAAIDLTTGMRTSWDPNASNSVRALVASKGTLYAGGDFTTIGGLSQRYLAGIAEDLSITHMAPNRGGVDGTVPAVIVGAGFQDGATANLVPLGAPDIPGTEVSVAAGGESLFATFDLTGAPLGLLDIEVTNPDLLTASLPDGFTIVTATYDGTAIAPNAGGVLFELDVREGFTRPVATLTGKPVTFTQAQLAKEQAGATLYSLLDPGMSAEIATIDGATAQVVNVASVQAATASGIALDPFGSRLFVAYGNGAVTDRLGELFPSNGFVRDMGALGFPSPGTEVGALAFSPAGQLYGLEDVMGVQSRVWQIDPRTREATSVGETPNGYVGYDDIHFIGDWLWASRAADGSQVQISVADASILDETTLNRTGLFGLAAASCTTPSEFFLARDNPRDEGQAILLDWTALPPPAGLSNYKIYRASSSCALLNPPLTQAGTVQLGEPQILVDTGVEDYTTYYYRIDAETTGINDSTARRAVVDITVAFSGPAVASPNVVVNEFAPSGGVPLLPKTGRLSRVQGGEFVELHNLSTTAIDLNGWWLSNGVNTQALSDTIPPNGFVTVLTDTLLNLPNEGGTLELLPPAGTSFIVDSVSYGTEGGAPTVPPGFTISRVDDTDSTDPDALSFGASTPTQGEENNAAQGNLGSSIVMNELYFLGGPGEDYVELYHPSGGPIALGRFALSDGPGFIDTLDVSVGLNGGEVMVFTDSTEGDPFTRDLGASSDLVYLYRFTEDNRLELVDQIGWAGRLEDSLTAIPEPDTLGGDLLNGNVALVRDPDGMALYTGELGATWFECGGGLTLRYGVRTPGLPNAPGDSATTIQVDPSGTGDALTIQDALAIAAAGPKPSVVLVGPGTYDESLTLVDSVSIRGMGAEVLDVMIRGVGGRTILTGFDLSSETRVSRVTIHGGHAASDGPFGTVPASGAGLRLMNSYAKFENVRFEFNVAKHNGGAVAVDGGVPTFRGCLFLENHAHASGGAVWAVASQPRFERCLFVGNESKAWGGALYLEGGATLIQYSVLDGNAAWGDPAGIVHATDSATVQVSLSMLTNGAAGAALHAEPGAFIGFSCGLLYNHPEPWDSGASELSVTSWVDLDPQYCDPEELIYSYGATSLIDTLLAMDCEDATNVGVAGPPCAPTPTAVPVQLVPRVTQLLQPSPNPFNPRTTIRWDLARPGLIDLTIYDVRGRRVARLLSATRLPAGRHEVVWAGFSDRGRRVASGIYLARLRVDGKSVDPVRRLVLIR